MIVIDLTQQVVDGTALTALTEGSLTDQQIVWNIDESAVYIYYPNAKSGDYAPNDQTEGTGYWRKDISIEGLDLDGYKRTRYGEIDSKTGELIAGGYTYASKQFSLSANAQTNILALYATKDNPALSYPIEYNTIDDTDVYSIANATDLEGMYLTALATKKTHLDSGTTLKDQVRSAVDAAAVQAIIDNR